MDNPTVEQIRELRDWVQGLTEDPTSIFEQYPQLNMQLLQVVVFDAFPRLATYTLELLGAETAEEPNA